MKIKINIQKDGVNGIENYNGNIEIDNKDILNIINLTHSKKFLCLEGDDSLESFWRSLKKI